MYDAKKTKAQLLEEVKVLRQAHDELEQRVQETLRTLGHESSAACVSVESKRTVPCQAPFTNVTRPLCTMHTRYSTCIDSLSSMPVHVSHADAPRAISSRSSARNVRPTIAYITPIAPNTMAIRRTE